MSIQKPDSFDSVESFDTALLTQIANELFFGSTHAAKIPGESPSTASNNGLAGSYPAETHSFVPAQGVNSYQPGVGPSTASPFYFIREPESFVPTTLAGGTTRAARSPLRFDVESVRRDFPALHQNVNGKPLIWFDNAATTHKPQSVIDATSQFYRRDNSNIHRAAHALAARSSDLFEGGREKVRQFIGAGDTKEIVFVRGTTEAINLVAQTFGRANIGAGDEIVLTTMEHHANIVPWQMLAQQTGAVIRVAPINDRGELI